MLFAAAEFRFWNHSLTCHSASLSSCRASTCAVICRRSSLEYNLRRFFSFFSIYFFIASTQRILAIFSSLPSVDLNICLRLHKSKRDYRRLELERTRHRLNFKSKLEASFRCRILPPLLIAPPQIIESGRRLVRSAKLTFLSLSAQF